MCTQPVPCLAHSRCSVNRLIIILILMTVNHNGADRRKRPGGGAGVKTAGIGVGEGARGPSTAQARCFVGEPCKWMPVNPPRLRPCLGAAL